MLGGSTLLGCPAALEDPERFAVTNSSSTTATCDAPAVFTARCAFCHGGPTPQNGVALDTEPALEALRGKPSGSGAGLLVDLGAPEKSVIYLKMTSPPFGSVMPPTGPLDAKDTQCVRTWLEGLAAGTPLPK